MNDVGDPKGGQAAHAHGPHVRPVVQRPYAKRMMALRASKSPPCGCGEATHDHTPAERAALPGPAAPAARHASHKGVGAIDSRGA